MCHRDIFDNCKFWVRIVVEFSNHFLKTSEGNETQGASNHDFSFNQKLQSFLAAKVKIVILIDVWQMVECITLVQVEVCGRTGVVGSVNSGNLFNI